MLFNDKSKFVALLAKVAQMYSKEISTVSLDIYWLLLERHCFDAIEKAVYRHVADPMRGRFMPLPADVIYFIEGALNATLAWTKVEKAIRLIGSYGSIVFDDPITHLVIDDKGGWIHLCEELSGKLPFYQQDFEHRYQHYFSYPPNEYPCELIGRISHHNKRFNDTEALPYFFGDKSRAFRVYQGGLTPQKIISKLTGVLDIKALTNANNQVKSLVQQEVDPI